jgi:hypothetical protein
MAVEGRSAGACLLAVARGLLCRGSRPHPAYAPLTIWILTNIEKFRTSEATVPASSQCDYLKIATSGMKCGCHWVVAFAIWCQSDDAPCTCKMHHPGVCLPSLSRHMERPAIPIAFSSLAPVLREWHTTPSKSQMAIFTTGHFHRSPRRSLMATPTPPQGLVCTCRRPPLRLTTLRRLRMLPLASVASAADTDTV